MKYKLQNCLNCGAPLVGDVCKYCGTSYADNPKDVFLVVYGEKIPCYVSDIEFVDVGGDCLGRDIRGRLIREPSKFIRKFRVVETPQ